MDFDAELKRLAARVEAGIDRYLPSADTKPARLHEAMRYSMLAGGKRLRPVLVLATAEMFGADAEAALPAAVAIECLHTYSLIHDDLPCMDNDDLRRGKPTAHRAFDEATALLAGDALLTEAFALIAKEYAQRPELAHALVLTLGDAAGSRRLIGGQMADLLAENQPGVTNEELEFIHLGKTAAMVEAALELGGRIGGASPDALGDLREAGRLAGLAFQITDDILDATSDSETLGKTAGKDARNGKTTFVSVHGIAQAREIAAGKMARAGVILNAAGQNNAFVNWILSGMISRIK